MGGTFISNHYSERLNGLLSKSAVMSGDRQTSRFVNKLKYAITDGDFKTAKRLIKGGVDVNATFWYDTTLLHEAVSSGNVDIVKLMLQSKADVNAQNKDGRTALHIVCRHGNKAIVDILLKAKADVNIQTQDGRTCLHVATWREHLNIVRLLLAVGADVDIKDNDGWTALHWAAKVNLTSAAELLIQNESSVNATDKLGRTALHESLTHDHTEMVRCLLWHGADPNIKPKIGTTLSLLTTHKVCPETSIKMLVSTGYRLQDDKTYKSGQLPAAWTNQKELLSWLQSQYETVPTLRLSCRRAIRRRINDTTGGKRLVKSVDLLPLPPALKIYIKETDFKVV